jgi:hypothetical protein
MVFVSIYPFGLKRIFLLILAVISLSSVSCFAESLFSNVASTPYDRQMTRIQPVLFSRGTSSKENLSLGLVNQWMGDLRGIPYGFSQEWKTPQEVYTAAVADCKGKAVALYERMHSRGAENIRLVIGRRMATSRRTHTWVEWKTASGTYVLDPTINWSACSAAQFGNGSYIPLYAYAGTQKYRAASATLYAQN